MKRLAVSFSNRHARLLVALFASMAIGLPMNVQASQSEGRTLITSGPLPQAGEIVAYWQLGITVAPNHILRICSPGGCAQTNTYGYFSPGIFVNPGDTITVELFNTNEGGYQGHPCGGWSAGVTSPVIFGNEWEDFDNEDCNDVRIEVGYRADTMPPTTTANVNCTLGNNGWCRSAAIIGLSATDSGSGVATTYFNGAPFTGPVTTATEGITSFTYYSVDNRSNAEPPHAGQVRIDTIAPGMNYSLSGASGLSGWYTSPVIVSLAADDATSGVDRVTFDSDPYSGPITISTQGKSTHSYFSTDLAGNSNAPQNLSLNIDTVSPGTSIGSASNGQPVAGTITLRGNATDSGSGISSISVSTNGGSTWLPASYSNGAWEFDLDTTGFPDGSLTVIVAAIDIAGLVQPTSGPSSTSVTLYVDNTAPSVSHLLSGTLGLADWYVSDVVVATSATDNESGISEITLNGIPYTIPVTVSTQGLTSWQYYATDVALNSSPVANVSFQIDSQHPATTTTSPADGELISGVSTIIHGTASDATSGIGDVEVSLDGHTWNAATLTSGVWSYTLDTTTLDDGPLTVMVRATDLAGNMQAETGPSSTHLQLIVDNSPPILSLDAPRWFCALCGQVLPVSFAIADTNGISSWALSVDGINTLLTGVTSDVGSTEWDGSGAASGTYIVRLVATDLAGNTAQIAQETVMGIPSAPKALIDLACGLSGDNGWCKAPVMVRLSGESSNPLEIMQLESGEDNEIRVYGGGSYSFEDGRAGQHSIWLRVRDSLGQVSSTSIKDYRVDGAPPEITFNGATSEDVNLNVSDVTSGVRHWTLRVFASDGETILWREDDGPISGAIGWRPMSSGSYTIEVFARDNAGHESSLSRQFQIALPVTVAIVNQISSVFLPQPSVVPQVHPTLLPTTQPAPSIATPQQVSDHAPNLVSAPVPAPMWVDLQGVVFHDSNNNGVRDIDELGLPGIEIVVLYGPEVVKTITLADGSYTLRIHAGKPYLVRVVQPVGWLLTSPGSLALSEWNTAPRANFGLNRQSSLLLLLLISMLTLVIVWLLATTLDRRASAIRELSDDMKSVLATRHRLGTTTLAPRSN